MVIATFILQFILFFSQLQGYITQFWGGGGDLQLREIKSELCYKKSQLPFYFYSGMAETSFHANMYNFSSALKLKKGIYEGKWQH